MQINGNDLQKTIGETIKATYSLLDYNLKSCIVTEQFMAKSPDGKYVMCTKATIDMEKEGKTYNDIIYVESILSE